MSKLLGVIGGSGLDQLGNGRKLDPVDTSPWGEPSDHFTEIELGENRLLFLPRHGYDHRLAPHSINYRANIMAFKNRGVSCILAINAVGGIAATMPPGTLVLVDQLVDYTWGRAQTYFEDGLSPPVHIEFAEPFSEKLRQQVLAAAQKAGVKIQPAATLAVTQGPRLETAAEIRKYKADGCDLVGMTSMPEAALAREAGLEYAALCVVGNYAAGIGEGETLTGMDAELVSAMRLVRDVIHAWHG